MPRIFCFALSLAATLLLVSLSLLPLSAHTIGSEEEFGQAHIIDPYAGARARLANRATKRNKRQDPLAWQRGHRSRPATNLIYDDSAPRAEPQSWNDFRKRTPGPAIYIPPNEPRHLPRLLNPARWFQSRRDRVNPRHLQKRRHRTHIDPPSASFNDENVPGQLWSDFMAQSQPPTVHIPPHRPNPILNSGFVQGIRRAPRHVGNALMWPVRHFHRVNEELIEEHHHRKEKRRHKQITRMSEPMHWNKFQDIYRR